MIPVNYKAVPLDPDQDMLQAGNKAGLDVAVLMDDTRFACEAATFKAMVAAVKASFVVNFTGLRCEEASIHSRETYIPCGQPAEAVIWHKRDGKNTYLMCAACADHNVRNRGGQLVVGVTR